MPLLASRLRMLRSDICRRAAMGGIRDSVAGRRVTSAFMSLSNSSSWFRTGARATEKEGQEKDREREGWSQETTRSQRDTKRGRKRHQGTRDQEDDRRRQKERLGGEKEGERPDEQRIDRERAQDTGGRGTSGDMGRGVVRTFHTARVTFCGWG